MDRPSLFRAGSAKQVLAVLLPKSRSYMHLDTVITMCDRDLVTLFPQVVGGARVWAIRPGESADDLVVEEQHGSLPELMAKALGVARCAWSRPAGTLRGRARAVGRRQQRRRARTRRRRRLRAQHRHQHRPAQGRHRGDHDRGLRARPWPGRLALHDLSRSSAIPRSDSVRATWRSTCATAASSRRSTSPRRAALPAAAGRGAQAGQVRGHRGEATRRQGDRAHLREDLHPHPVRVRGRRLRPGRARDLPRPVRLAAGAQGIDRRHRRSARAACTTRSSSAATARRTSRPSPRTPACRSTTG